MAAKAPPKTALECFLEVMQTMAPTVEREVARHRQGRGPAAAAAAAEKLFQVSDAAALPLAEDRNICLVITEKELEREEDDDDDVHTYLRMMSAMEPEGFVGGMRSADRSRAERRFAVEDALQVILARFCAPMRLPLSPNPARHAPCRFANVWIPPQSMRAKVADAAFVAELNAALSPIGVTVRTSETGQFGSNFEEMVDMLVSDSRLPTEGPQAEALQFVARRGLNFDGPRTEDDPIPHDWYVPLPKGSNGRRPKDTRLPTETWGWRTDLEHAVGNDSIEDAERAIAGRYPPMVREFIEYRILLIKAVNRASPEMVEWVLAHGAAADSPDDAKYKPARELSGDTGATALSRAAYLGKTETMRVLLAHGADKSLLKGGVTPAFSAALMGRVEGLRMLVEAGADVSIRTVHGHSPLQIARQNYDHCWQSPEKSFEDDEEFSEENVHTAADYAEIIGILAHALGKEPDKFCAHCQRRDGFRGTKLKKCGRCHVASYCDAKCQKAHWPVHKQSCHN